MLLFLLGCHCWHHHHDHHFDVCTIFVLSVCAGYKLTPSSAQKRFPLLTPTLDGLTKYAHLIDVDYFADLLQVCHSLLGLHAHTHQLE